MDDFVVAYVGTHGMAHDLFTVLESAKLLACYESITYLFVGEGAVKSSLVDYKEKYAMPNVCFHAAVPKERMPVVWSLCDVVLIPLKNHATFSTVVPSKLFEALAMGKVIVLVSPEGEASRLLKEHDCGVHVVPETPGALKVALERLYLDKQLRIKYAANAFEAAKLFIREEQAKKMIKTFGLLSNDVKTPAMREGTEGEMVL
jgi:colanic acid biosynthesis glycosyl transferase WcaI